MFQLKGQTNLRQLWLLDHHTGMWAQQSHFSLPSDGKITLNANPGLFEIDFDFKEIVFQDQSKVTVIGAS